MSSVFPDVTPTWVQPENISYNVIETLSENNVIETDMVSSTPVRKYTLYWSGVTDGDYAAILAHWRDVSGTYDTVTWDCVPDYIDGGGGLGDSMQGHWEGMPQWNPDSKSWNLRMVFIKDI